uniref:AB hydrolase-1 domain-containing protein n=1 Tax=Kalanchoe fedtschenkoi TaxID=63787 RepID=A0A7N0UC26_KALFE
MAASGIDTRSIQDVRTLAEYSQPLLDFMKELPPDEKVVLVGHSLGGMCLAIAMEKFPEKIALAVFLTAFMPDTVNPPSHVLNEFFDRASPAAWLDTVFTTQDSPSEPRTLLFGPEFMKQKLYQNSPKEDLELASMLIRPGSLFTGDLIADKKFTAEAYGSVKQVFVVCGEDLTLPAEVQHWMIENFGAITDIMDIPKADHMSMMSKPEEVVKCLLEAAGKYT